MLTPTPTATPENPPEIPRLARILQEKARPFLPDLSLSVAEALVRHCASVIEASREVNVTGVKTLEDGIIRLVLDSLAAVPCLQRERTLRHVIDLGTGGGFPGVPLALVLPDTKWTLVEGRRKKLDVALRCARAFGLSDLRGEWGQLRDLSKKGELLHQCADAVVTRAVGPLPEVLREARASLRMRGLLIVWKGDPIPPDEASEGLSLAKTLGYGVEFDQPYESYRASRLLGFRKIS